MSRLQELQQSNHNLRAGRLPTNSALLDVARESGASNQQELVEARLYKRMRERRGAKTAIVDTPITRAIATSSQDEMYEFFRAHLRKYSKMHSFAVYRDASLHDPSVLKTQCGVDMIDWPSLATTFENLDKFAADLSGKFSDQGVAAIETLYTKDERWMKVYRWKSSHRPWEESLVQAREQQKEIENELDQLENKAKFTKKDQARRSELEEQLGQLSFPPAPFLKIGYSARA